MKNFSQSSFVRFFTKFPKLLLAGIMFSIPFAIFTAIFGLIGHLLNFNNLIILGLGIIPSFPFYSGLVMVVRKISVEKADCNVANIFVDAVRENWKKSLINGIITYVIAASSIFALMYYGSVAFASITYSSLFTLYMLFSVVLLVMMFYVPLMTITYELKISDIYKNSFLLIFGKILRNIGALILVVVFNALVLFALVYSSGAVLITFITLIVILYPLIFTYIVVSVIAKGLQDTVGDFVDVTPQVEATAEEIELEKQALENSDSDDDYIFVNGKMIKNPAKND